MPRKTEPAAPGTVTVRIEFGSGVVTLSDDRLAFLAERRVRMFLYGESVNMRYSFDGLHALVRNSIKVDPLDGEPDPFINRRATQMKAARRWDLRAPFTVRTHNV